MAYHLAELGQRCTVLEQTAVACAASGKSGGFLALDWCDGSAQGALARASFPMHAQFPVLLDADLGYRPVSSLSVSLVSPRSSTAAYQKRRSHNGIWVDGDAIVTSRPRVLGTEETNAQVHPRKLTHALLDAARQKAGSEVVCGARVEAVLQENGAVRAVKIRNAAGEISNMECDALVLAMGPWTIDAMAWFPGLPPIIAQKAASLVIKETVPPQALFSEFVNARGDARSPEAYPRADEVYLCQSALAEELPADPSSIVAHESDVDSLREFARALSSKLAEALDDETKVTAQACNLPISPDGIPIIGPIPDTSNAFVASGHSCWGILNSPATGKALAELIVHGVPITLNLEPFHPGRFTSRAPTNQERH